MPSLKIDIIVDDKGRPIINQTTASMKDLDAATKKANSSMSSHSSALAGLKNNWLAITGGIAAAVAAFAVVGGAFSSLRASIETMDKLSESSQKIGVSAETLQVWGLAAKQSGVDAESLEKGLGMLAKNAYAQKDAFSELGVKVTDAQGNLKSIDVLLPEIADKFSKMEDGTKKAALAKEILGKAGMNLVPVLNLAGKGLEEVAEKMGYIASTEDTARAHEFSKTIENMHRRTEGLKMALMSGALPALNDLADVFGIATGKGEGLKNLGKEIGDVLKDIASFASSSVSEIQLWGIEIERTVLKAKNVLGQGEFDPNSWDNFTSSNIALDKKAEDIEKRRQKIYMALFGDKPAPGKRSMGGGGTPKPDTAKADQEAEAMASWLEKAKELDPFLDELAKKKESLAAEAEKLTRKFGEQKWIAEGLKLALDNIDLDRIIKGYMELAKNIEYLEDDEKLATKAIIEFGYEEVKALEKIYTESTKRLQAFEDEFATNTANARNELASLMNDNSATVKDFADLWEQRMSSMADAITEFCQTGRFEFTNMVNSMTADMMKLYYKQMMFGKGDQGGGLFEKGLGFISGMFSSPGTNDMTGGWSSAGSGAQNMLDVWNGPAFGDGGVVSSPMLAKVGEVPEAIIPLNRIGSSPNVNVNIINNAGANVTQTSSPDGNGGINLEVMIDSAVAKQLGTRGSQSARTMRQGYGAMPTLTRR